MGWLEGELGWWRASGRAREAGLGLETEVFRLEPVAARYCQEQQDKEDGEGQRDLVKTMADARGDGNR